MKSLVDSVDSLVNVRKRMGAGLVDVGQIHIPGVPVIDDKMLKAGITLSGLEMVKGRSNGILVVDDKPVIVYIQDTWHSKYLLETTPEKSKKVHVTECHTIIQMRRKGRGERYIATTRDDGLFLVHFRNQDRSTGEMQAALRVCKHCLIKVRSIDSVSEFSFSNHLSRFGSGIVRKPTRTDQDHNHWGYSRDWPEISEKIRTDANWNCSSCQADLEHSKWLLHVHHVDGCKSNNSPQNLRVLCLLCHAEQPNHGHIRRQIAANDQEIIMSARNR